MVVEEEIRLNLLVADLLSIVLNVSSDDLLKKGDIEQQYISPSYLHTCIPPTCPWNLTEAQKTHSMVDSCPIQPGGVGTLSPGTHQTPYRYNDKSSGGLDIAAVWQ